MLELDARMIESCTSRLRAGNISSNFSINNFLFSSSTTSVMEKKLLISSRFAKLSLPLTNQVDKVFAAVERTGKLALSSLFWTCGDERTIDDTRDNFLIFKQRQLINRLCTDKVQTIYYKIRWGLHTKQQRTGGLDIQSGAVLLVGQETSRETS